MKYRQNVTIVEKAAIKHRVKSVRYHGATSERKGKVSRDSFGFGQTFTDTNRIHCYKGQGSYKGKVRACELRLQAKVSQNLRCQLQRCF